jgi:hypothetical protein
MDDRDHPAVKKRLNRNEPRQSATEWKTDPFPQIVTHRRLMEDHRIDFTFHRR